MILMFDPNINFVKSNKTKYEISSGGFYTAQRLIKQKLSPSLHAHPSSPLSLLLTKWAPQIDEYIIYRVNIATSS